MSLKGTQEGEEIIDGSDLTAIRLQPLHIVSPNEAQDVKKHRRLAPDS